MEKEANHEIGKSLRGNLLLLMDDEQSIGSAAVTLLAIVTQADPLCAERDTLSRRKAACSMSCDGAAT